MSINATCYRKNAVRSAVVLATLMSAACAPPYQPPQQVQASTPTITYKYHTDTDLLQVNQTATNYCRQYQAVAQAASFTNDPDGSKVVVYDCVQSTTVVTIPAPEYNPNLAYSYRTDQELLNAQRNAQVY
jgi:hypothetical protein